MRACNRQNKRNGNCTGTGRRMDRSCQSTTNADDNGSKATRRGLGECLQNTFGRGARTFGNNSDQKK